MLRQSFAPLIDLLYPPRCPACGEGLAAQDGLCAECWRMLATPGEPACSLCARPFGDTTAAAAGAVCAPCLAQPPLHDGIAAAAVYGDVSRKLVLSFKHGRRIALAPLLARMTAARLPELEGEWLVIPVPLHWTRLWRRGFNQSGLMAQHLARTTGHALLLDGLVRRKPTQPLGGLGRKARARVLSGAIATRGRHRETLRGRRVILVDDVLTSGATTGACVSVLKRDGAEKVLIACFARVLDQA